MKKLLFFVILISPCLAKAQAFATGYQGDKQSAMGNAGVALPLDVSAMAYNPAATAFLPRRTAISVGGAAAITNTAYVDSSNYSLSKTKNAVGTPFHANFGYSVKDSTSKLGKFKFGFGIGTPYGGDTHWNDNWTGRYSVIEKKLTSVI